MSWNGIKTWTNEPLINTDLNTYVSDNLDALKNPPSKISNLNESSNYTLVAGGATAFANVDSTDTEGKLRLTIDTTGGAIFVTGMFTVNNNTTAIATQFTLSVDGTIHPAAGDDGIFSHRPNVGANTQLLVSFNYWLHGYSAGTHIIRLMWKVSGASTATLYAGAGTSLFDVHPQFAVMELGNFS